MVKRNLCNFSPGSCNRHGQGIANSDVSVSQYTLPHICKTDCLSASFVLPPWSLVRQFTRHCAVGMLATQMLDRYSKKTDGSRKRLSIFDNSPRAKSAWAPFRGQPPWAVNVRLNERSRGTNRYSGTYLKGPELYHLHWSQNTNTDRSFQQWSLLPRRNLAYWLHLSVHWYIKTSHSQVEVAASQVFIRYLCRSIQPWRQQKYKDLMRKHLPPIIIITLSGS